ncbi:MAG TPA: D-aminoacylase, partial [Longimicrobiales bacterium]|nr:D-aminoacylase [Longimicrobiales bacterium]
MTGNGASRRRVRVLGGLLAATAVASLVGCGGEARPYDLLIRGGRVVDGTGNPWFQADVAVREGTIAAVGRIGDAGADRVIDASGLTVVPGFIDMHSHSDYTLLVDGNAESKVRQGVTTEILGENGSAGPLVGPARAEMERRLEGVPVDADWTTLGEYFSRLEESGISVNVASYVGTGQVRMAVMGAEDREPSEAELAQMESLVEEAMRDGALGVSSALSYVPNTFMSSEEMVRLARVAARNGGIYATHLRRQDVEIEAGIREAIEIGRSAGLPVHIFHFKVKHPEMWGRFSAYTGLVDEARAGGIAVTADLYPYIAGVTGLAASLPPRFLEGGTEAMLERIRDPRVRDEIRRDIARGLPGWENEVAEAGGWDRMVVSAVRRAENKEYEGMSLARVAEMMGKDPVDAACELLLSEGGNVRMIQHAAAEEDLEHAIALPWTAIGSDGIAMNPDGFAWLGKPHPRYYGTYSRVLDRYVGEKGLLSFSDAIRKMTSLPAQILGFRDRGLLRPGMRADIVLLDADRLEDRATFEEPQLYPVGIEYVF